MPCRGFSDGAEVDLVSSSNTSTYPQVTIARIEHYDCAVAALLLRCCTCPRVRKDQAPFTAKTLCELVGASTASGSLALRALEGNGMIYRTRPAGARADLFDLVDEAQYGMRYADRYLQPISSMRRALASLEPGSKAWLRLSSAIDLFEYLAKEVPEVFVRWQRENAAIYGR